VRRCDDDDRIDRAFNAVCRQIWGYTLETSTTTACRKDHALLDRMTWKRACKFALENGYDLVDPAPAVSYPSGGVYVDDPRREARPAHARGARRGVAALRDEAVGRDQCGRRDPAFG